MVVGVLREILAADRSESCYGFRCENGFSMLRRTDYKGLAPHGGGVGTGMFAYQCVNRGIFSGLTRVVWELNPIEEGDGGTLFMSGSHKANFPIHETHREMDSPLYESYVCPPGAGGHRRSELPERPRRRATCMRPSGLRRSTSRLSALPRR